MSDEGQRRSEIAEGIISVGMAAAGMAAPFAGGMPAQDVAVESGQPEAVVREVTAADTDVAPWFTGAAQLPDGAEDWADAKLSEMREQAETALDAPAEPEYANEAPPAAEVAEYWDDVADAAFGEPDSAGWEDAAPDADVGMWADGGAPDGGFDGGPGGLF
ncbi:MAG: hypothetical protein HZB46_09960 [Solirubrobacterales bacterium]|nr:hypothetical protein [Solirubrobacterales bacterium]